MSNINDFIRNNVIRIGKGVFLAPDIPEKKLNNAVKAMSCEHLLNSIIAIQDGTVMGASDKGFIFTGERMIHHLLGEFPYSDIESVEYVGGPDPVGSTPFLSGGITAKATATVSGILTNSTEKEVVVTKLGERFVFKSMYGIDEREFANFLHSIISNFSEFKEESQVLILSEMSDDFKITYMKIIVNMTFDDDGDIDDGELSEILLLMTRLQLSKEARFEVREYIEDISDDSQASTKDLILKLKNMSDSSQLKSIMISLVKDLINTHYSSKNNFDGDVSFINSNKSLFCLSDEEINFAYEAVKESFKIFDADVDDDKIKDGASKLASAAAAVGVPIAAVYISGSVVGLSAAGVTSGLATLGLGMGMTGGLAVLGAVGFLTYTGVRHISGANELDKFKVKLMMLNEALKQTHLTVMEVIEDINYLVSKLNDAMSDVETNRDKLIAAEAKISKFVSALKKTSEKADRFENTVNRTKCPKNLDHGRFYELTNEPTKKDLYYFVMGRYLETSQDDKSLYVLKDGLSTKELDKVSEILEKIGYFDMSKSIKAKTASAIGDIFK